MAEQLLAAPCAFRGPFWPDGPDCAKRGARVSVSICLRCGMREERATAGQEAKKVEGKRSEVRGQKTENGLGVRAGGSEARDGKEPGPQASARSFAAVAVFHASTSSAPSASSAVPSPFVVSAVLPARDEGADVAATVASFLAAGVDEVIVVDDASRDGSCAEQGFLGLDGKGFSGFRASGLGTNTKPQDPKLQNPAVPAPKPQNPAVAVSKPQGPKPESPAVAVPKPQGPKPQNPAVRVIRNPAPLGCALCRNIGGRAATGDVIIFADAHMRAESSLRDFALAAHERGVILNAAVKPLDGEHNTTVYGARIVPDRDSPAYRMAHIVRRPDPGQRFVPIPGLHGACYAIPRQLWDRLDGWVENQGWGYNEQALSMKAFFLAIRLESDAQTIVRHRYRKQFPYTTPLSLTLLNRFITHRTLFDDATWRRLWLPLFAKAWPAIAADWAKLDRSRRFWKLRDNFRKAKVRTDEEFFREAVSTG